MGYKTQPGSLDELKMQMALLDHVKGKASEDRLAGGQGGRWMTQQQDKAKADSASKLDAYLKMSKAYPGMKPTQGVQNAGNTMMAGPMGQIGSNYGVQPQGNAMPSMSPGQAQRQSKGKDIKSEMNAKFEFWYDRGEKMGLKGPELQEFVTGQTNKTKTGGLTGYQTSRQSNATESLLKAVSLGKGVNEWGQEADLDSPEAAYAFISRAGMRDSNININDPRFKATVETLFPVEKPKQTKKSIIPKIGNALKGVFQGAATVAKETSPAYHAVKAIKNMGKDKEPSTTRQAMGEIMGNNPGLQAWYKDARGQGATDEQLFQYIMNKNNQGSANAE